jgi:hypothetical protein
MDRMHRANGKIPLSRLLTLTALAVAVGAWVGCDDDEEIGPPEGW